MTHIYFVRHAQPDHSWVEDRTRPLTEAGVEDSRQVVDALKNIKLDYATSSPYKRSMDTILACVEDHGLELHTDERFRERESGLNARKYENIKKRWENKEFHEEGGESLNMLQKRNVEALMELLCNHEGENMIIGTHGAALSSILNYYNPEFKCEDFLRFIDYMPYIIRLDFDGMRYLGQEEILILEKEYIPAKIIGGESNERK